MIDFICVKETPWGQLGKQIENQTDKSEYIVEQMEQSFTVAADPMKTDLLGLIPSYHAVYRTDNTRLLSVINHYPNLVQNSEMFNAVDYLLLSEATFECGGAIGNGQQVFGIIKLKDAYKVDSDIDNYVILINDHSKSDGKITIINALIHLPSMCMLQYAMPNRRYCYRIPSTDDISTNRNLGGAIFENAQTCVKLTSKYLNGLKQIAIDDSMHFSLMDSMFPYQTNAEGDMLDNSANENVTIRRELFTDCLNESHLAEYSGTAYQYYFAMLDFTQHYFSNVNHAYDLTKRMCNVPGIGQSPEAAQVNKLLKLINKQSSL